MLFRSTGGATGVPLRDMGRLRHEACAVDPVRGDIYETEDITLVGNETGISVTGPVFVQGTGPTASTQLRRLSVVGSLFTSLLAQVPAADVPMSATVRFPPFGTTPEASMNSKVLVEAQR